MLVFALAEAKEHDFNLVKEIVVREAWCAAGVVAFRKFKDLILVSRIWAYFKSWAFAAILAMSHLF